MADTATTALTAKATLAGTETIYIVDGANSRKSTAQAVADLVTPTSLSLVIGTDVQAYDANLPAWPAGVDATEVGYLNGVTSAIQTQLDAKSPKATPVTTQAGTTYTLDADDINTIILFTNAAGCAVTVPNGVFAAGDFVELHQQTSGTVAVAGNGTSTVNSRGGLTDLAGQWAVAGLRCTASNVFNLTGDIA